MKLWKKAWLLLVLGVSMLVGGTFAFAQSQPVYGVVLKTLANPYWSAMERGLLAGAKEVGVRLVIVSAPSDQAPLQQLNVCETLLSHNIDALIAAAENSANLLTCLRQASDKGIPVVDLDGNLNLSLAAQEGVKVAFQIASNNYLAGKKAAEFITRQLGRSNTTGQVLVIQGLAGNVSSIERTAGFTDTLKSVATNLKIVVSLPGNWSSTKAYNITADTLQRYPSLSAIYAANDVMGLGAVGAVEAAGKTGQVVIVSTDGDQANIKAIQKGQETATVAQMPYSEGKLAITLTHDLLAGKSVALEQYVPTLLVAKEVIAAGPTKYPLLNDLYAGY